MKNKKPILIVLSIVLCYLILAIILFGWDKFINKFQGLYVMLDPDSMWRLKDGKWSDVKEDKEYNWKKFDIYINNKLLGNYNLLYNKKWYVFNDNREAIKYEGDLIAIKGNKKYKVYDFEEEELNLLDETLISEVLNQEKIKNSYEYTYARKVVFDFDGDTLEETLYTVSNTFNYSTEVNEVFSLVFLHDDINQVLYKSTQNIDRQYDVCLPKIKGIIDFDKDNKLEIIIGCNYYDSLGTCNSLYQIKDGKYIKVKGC